MEKEMKKTQLFLVIVLMLLANSVMFALERYVEDTPMPKISHRATISVTDMDEDGVTAQDLVNKLSGGGIVISNISYTGANVAAGIFTGGNQSGIGINEGIILSTGSAKLAVGPNQHDNASVDNRLPGDADLNALLGSVNTYDACVLEFDFIPETDNIQFTFVLGSDEYEEYLEYHDVFGFFLNGVNIALIPGTTTPISIGTINPNLHWNHQS